METTTIAKADIIAFCERHGARVYFRGWATANCDSMADVWTTAEPAYLVWVATREGVLPDRDLQLFACWCTRQVWQEPSDRCNQTGVAATKRHDEGHAYDEEMIAAWAAAGIVRDTQATARIAAYAAADVAAWIVHETLGADAAASVRADQAAWLRANTNPTF